VAAGLQASELQLIAKMAGLQRLSFEITGRGFESQQSYRRN
jgi:hypothetical protein